eukprot:659779-Rhodomonas_salina.1
MDSSVVFRISGRVTQKIKYCLHWRRPHSIRPPHTPATTEDETHVIAFQFTFNSGQLILNDQWLLSRRVRNSSGVTYGGGVNPRLQ